MSCPCCDSKAGCLHHEAMMAAGATDVTDQLSQYQLCGTWRWAVHTKHTVPCHTMMHPYIHACTNSPNAGSMTSSTSLRCCFRACSAFTPPGPLGSTGATSISCQLRPPDTGAAPAATCTTMIAHNQQGSHARTRWAGSSNTGMQYNALLAHHLQANTGIAPPRLFTTPSCRVYRCCQALETTELQGS